MEEVLKREIKSAGEPPKKVIWGLFHMKELK